MMVLMTRQRSAAGESLLAIRIRALVRALSRVDTAMAGQRAGITKRLHVVLDMAEQRGME